jgi:hypothetical protein
MYLWLKKVSKYVQKMYFTCRYQQLKVNCNSQVFDLKKYIIYLFTMKLERFVVAEFPVLNGII